MKDIEENIDVFKKYLDLIEKHFGSNCEVVLHNFLKNYEHTIVDIRNGHVTGRAIGGCATSLGFEILQGTAKPEDQYNYITFSPNGKLLRSSSIYFLDDEGKPIGSLCINLDITDTVYCEKILSDYNKYQISTAKYEGANEYFIANVNELLDLIIKQAMKNTGKSPSDLNKEEKIEFISFLDTKGAFIITKSSEKVCSLLGISKYTFYNYLDEARKKG